MSGENMDVKLQLKVMVNKERDKELYAVADNHFADILLSFLTLLMGRIVKVLEKYYGDKAPTFGSLNTLYRSVANLDCSHFVTEGAKKVLINPMSSFEDEHRRLKLDITDSPPAVYFYCTKCPHNRFRSVSMYYDNPSYCHICSSSNKMIKEVVGKKSEAATGDGAFTIHKASFIISDDLQIMPSETGFFQIISILAFIIIVDFGSSEMLSLLKASFVSSTPLSDLILDKTGRTNSVTVVSEPKRFIETEHQANPNAKKMILKAMVQKSSGKLLYAQAEEDFVEFLFSFFNIPVGGAEHLVAGKTGIKAIDNLYQSTIDLIDDKYFKSPDSKKRLVKPNLLHGCNSKEYILPLTEEGLPSNYSDPSLFSSVKFPKGKGRYLDGPTTYLVTDDLVVTTFLYYLQPFLSERAESPNL